MKKFTFNDLLKLKILSKIKDKNVLVSRGTGEVTVDAGSVIVTGKPKDIAIFMQNLTKMSQL